MKTTIIDGLTSLGLAAYVLAPLSGALMSMSTASTTAGETGMSIGEHLKLIP